MKLHNLEPSKFRIIRHGSKHFDPLALYRDDKEFFNEYQSFQQECKFGDAEYIAVFAPYHSTQALFLGIWPLMIDTILKGNISCKE